MSLSRYEQETTILFNEEEKTAQVFVSNKSLLNRLHKILAERPGEITKVHENEDGSAIFVLPKKWVKINPGRILSDERKKELSDRLQRARESNITK